MTVLRLLGACALISIAACQPTTGSTPQKTTQANSSATAATANVLGNLPAHCENIPLQMSAITNRSDVQSLAVVNQALKKCVPDVNHTTQKQWLEDSNAMYERFLDLQTTEQSAGVWDEFSWTLEGHPKETSEERQERLQQQQKVWPKLNDRMKQMSQWLGKEYIDNFYLGEGIMQLRRSPQYILDIFAPYMPDAEKAFMTQLGKENLTLTTNDAAIVVSWPTLAERALFWEQYIQKFPDSPYLKFAEYQFQWYSATLYHGLDNTPFIDTYSNDLFVATNALATHQYLAALPESRLSEPSQTVVKWIEYHQPNWSTLSEADRERSVREYQSLIPFEYPEPITGTTKDQYYDCSIDAVCQPYMR